MWLYRYFYVQNVTKSDNIVFNIYKNINFLLLNEINITFATGQCSKMLEIHFM